VEIVRSALEAYNRLDPDAFVESATTDFEWFPAMGVAVGDGAFRGRDGVARFMEKIRETWLKVEVVTEELRDLGDRVLVLGRQKGHGRGRQARCAVPPSRRLSPKPRYSQGPLTVGREILDAPFERAVREPPAQASACLLPLDQRDCCSVSFASARRASRQTLATDDEGQSRAARPRRLLRHSEARSYVKGRSLFGRF